MKRLKYCLLSVILLFVITVQAQSNIVKGGKYIAIKYGASKYSFPTFGQFEFGWAVKEKMVVKLGTYFEHGQVGTTVFNIPGINIDYTYNAFSIKNKLYGNFGIGGQTGLEYIKSDRVAVQKEQNIVYGGKASFELDFLISRRIALRYEFTEWYSYKSKIGNWYYTNTLGIVYILK